MTKLHKNLLILILGLALGMRITLALHHPFTFDDSKDYDTLARTLLQNHAYQLSTPTGVLYATRMPGYPFLVAAVYALTSYSQTAVLIFQALLGTLTVLLVHRIAGRISQPIALLAAFLAALDPLSLGFSAALLSEIPFTFTLMLCLWLALLIAETPRPPFRLWIWLGLVWSLAVYLRPSALWCIVPIALLLLLTNPSRLRPLIGTLITLALILLALLPWQIRNYTIFHSRVFRLTTLEGISLYEAVYPEADGSPKQDKILIPLDMSGMDEAQRNDEWTRRAWQTIASDPARIAKLALAKIARTWSPSFNAADFQNKTIQLCMNLWYIPLFVLAIIGVIVRSLPTKQKMLLVLPILYFTLVHALFLGSVRYRVPLMPIVCIFAAASLSPFLRKPKPSPDPTV